MKKFITILCVGFILTASAAVYGQGCLSNHQNRQSFYNARKQADNFTNFNNKQRVQNYNGPEWVQRQQIQNYNLGVQKRQNSDAVESLNGY